MADWQPSASLAVLQRRAQMLRKIREYFSASGALEVETPTLSAGAVTDVHLASVRAEVNGIPRFLHTSPEYAMKRMLAAHRCDIWQIARVYRDGELGRYHNPEFTMIEWYRLGFDHHRLMDEVERIIIDTLAPRTLGASERLSYREAVLNHGQLDPFECSIDALRSRLGSFGVDVPANLGQLRDDYLDLLMSTVVGPKLGTGHLTFIYDYPASQAALAKVRGAVASRFEVYLDGLELANGFHELSDASEQRQRFEQDLILRGQRGLPAMPMDRHFLSALENGLPECAGVALGFDRLVMCAIGAQHIGDVLAFAFDRA
jgi:lysyl-tRNA synthetase class 2